LAQSHPCASFPTVTTLSQINKQSLKNNFTFSKYWAWNAVLTATHNPMIFNDTQEEKTTASFKILVVRRF
jgi:hypothetical protein